MPTSWLDRLQKNAQQNELEPDNTRSITFWFLSFIQPVVLIYLSQYFSAQSFEAVKVEGWEKSRIELNRWVWMAIFNIAVHWAGFFFAVLIDSVKYFDITEDIGYMAAIYWSYSKIPDPSTRQQIAYGCAIIWNIRLLCFLGYRIIVRGRDFRFDKLNEGQAYQFFGWTSGGTWCWANGFALWFVAECKQDVALGPVDFLGVSLFAMGLLFELISDIQKYKFNRAHEAGTNKRWIDSGLWSASRHPNYFFENMLWFGVSLICMSGKFTDVFSVATCLVTPLWSFFFLVFTSMMLLEKRADKKWGDDPKYQEYKARTPVWFPRLTFDEAKPREPSTGRSAKEE